MRFVTKDEFHFQRVSHRQNEEKNYSSMFSLAQKNWYSNSPEANENFNPLLLKKSCLPYQLGHFMLPLSCVVRPTRVRTAQNANHCLLNCKANRLVCLVLYTQLLTKKLVSRDTYNTYKVFAGSRKSSQTI